MSTEAGAAAPVPGDSALARIPGTFFSPGKTFESIAARPTWLAPLLLWTAVSVLFTATLLPKIDWEKVVRQAIERRGQSVPEDRMSGIIETQKKIGTTVTWCIAVVAPVAVCLLVAVVIWGAFKAFGWDSTFRQARGATAHAFLPGVLGTILAIPLVMRVDTVDPQAIGDLVRSNLGFLVERNQKALHSLLSSLDIFSFWTIALLSIGFAAAAKVRKGQAAGVVVTLWALFVLGKAGFAALF
ncbi:MAG TPA: YIP1 family protein [Thermoanaerobaculia bacterium]